MNLAAVLKEEIRRLARKEVRAQTAATKRVSAAHRRDLARVKRQVRSFERRLAQLVRQLDRFGESGGKQTVDTAATSNRFSARSVRAQRRRLKLSAAEYGSLVGVSGQTIYQWEHGKSRPRRSQMAALVALRSIGRRQALARLSGSGGREKNLSGREKGRQR